MKLREPSVEIITKDCPLLMLQRIEEAGRVCYQSESTGDSAKFVETLIKKGHHSVLEHVSISIRLIVDRGVSHELVRHRLAAYSQESTRYCDYDKDDIEYIKPFWYAKADLHTRYTFNDFLAENEVIYKSLRTQGLSPQEARAVLPNCLKTEMIMTANVREWRHILSLRTSKAAHPDIRYIMGKVLLKFKSTYAVLFDDIVLSGGAV